MQRLEELLSLFLRFLNASVQNEQEHAEPLKYIEWGCVALIGVLLLTGQFLENGEIKRLYLLDQPLQDGRGGSYLGL